MVDGTDSVTEIHGIGSRTQTRLEGDTVREFVTGRTDVSSVSSQEYAAAKDVLTADIDTFDAAPTEADVMMAQLATAKKMRFEPQRENRPGRWSGGVDEPNSIDSFDGAYTEEPYMYVGDLSPTNLRNYPQYSTRANSITPAFLLTEYGEREAVYLISDAQGPYARPNERVQATDGPIETVIPAWAIEAVADVFGENPPDLLDMFWFEQSSPLVISDDDTGFEAMVASAVVEERSDTATEYAQEEGREKDPAQYVLELGLWN